MGLGQVPRATVELQREYQREWMQRRRREWLAGKSCTECGTTDELRVHHVDPTLKVTHNVWSWSRTRREAELAKCVVLCSPCHIEHHAALLRKPCGEAIGGYDRGCRCDKCRNLKRLRAADYRARVRQRSIV